MKDLSSHPFNCSIWLNWNEVNEFDFLSLWPFLYWNWNQNPCQCCRPIDLFGIFFRWRHRMKAKSTNRLYHNFNMCLVSLFFSLPSQVYVCVNQEPKWFVVCHFVDWMKYEAKTENVGVTILLENYVFHSNMELTSLSFNSSIIQFAQMTSEFHCFFVVPH